MGARARATGVQCQCGTGQACCSQLHRHPISRRTSCIVVQVRSDVLFFLQLMKEGDTEGDVVDLACSLASLGHGVTVRQAVGGGENCFKNLFHEFLLIKVRSPCSCHPLGPSLFISAWLTPIQLRHLCIVLQFVACGCAVQRQFEKINITSHVQTVCFRSGQAVLTTLGLQAHALCCAQPIDTRMVCRAAGTAVARTSSSSAPSARTFASPARPARTRTSSHTCPTCLWGHCSACCRS